MRVGRGPWVVGEGAVGGQGGGRDGGEGGREERNDGKK